MFYQPLPIIFLLISVVYCTPERVDADHDHGSQIQQEAHSQDLPDHVAPLEKRSPHYNFGLGKRAYSYVSEYKRLPVYNFGLGKRSRPYSFGLGKRSVEEDQTDEDFSNDLEQVMQPEMFDQYEDAAGYEEKRARPYSFGLGKRFDDQENEEKRARMYDFGLGKRPHLYSFGLGKRARSYNFGLGKRLSSKFNFGLGKRERDLHRFSFGLGKRSDMVDDNDGYYEV